MKDLLFLKKNKIIYLLTLIFLPLLLCLITSLHLSLFSLSPFYILANIQTLKFLFLVDYVKHATELILSHILKKGGWHHPTQAPQQKFSLHCRHPMQLCTPQR